MECISTITVPRSARVTWVGRGANICTLWMLGRSVSIFAHLGYGQAAGWRLYVCECGRQLLICLGNSFGSNHTDRVHLHAQSVATARARGRQSNATFCHYGRIDAS